MTACKKLNKKEEEEEEARIIHGTSPATVRAEMDGERGKER